MSQKILFITPPFTQLNTPYPATPYLKGFLKTRGIVSNQVDLSLEVILAIFSKKGLGELFDLIVAENKKLSDNAQRILSLRNEYLQTIDSAIRFLQNKNATLAYAICERTFLPEASRFTEERDDLEWAFGSMGIHDLAKHLVTLYLEDISDLIVEAIDPNFGFSRYAEKLGRCATSFDEIEKRLLAECQWMDQILISLLDEKIKLHKPTVVSLTVPFPGNLYCALKIGQYLKEKYPAIKIVLGGGFANTELRTMSDNRIFDYVDFVTLDDGELPLLQLIKHLDGEIATDGLKRTLLKVDATVQFFDDSTISDFKQSEIGIPDYNDLYLDRYLSVIEMVNPMHRLWSDGRWNKLTLAHGCYWGKCSFCDTTLDYICRYEPNSVATLCDRIEALIEQTGHNGFHFVDEAAPPILLKELAIEIIRRGIKVVWWTNIRFEKSYSNDLCRLLKASGCIAVSGGLEVASDRLLKLINKGVTVAQVAQVANHFTQNGIMVHAYLMYGFPTQTEREIIDSLEMVRQLFRERVLHSAFWHLFTLTAHSPIGQNPTQYGITAKENSGGFANNDLVHHDPTGADHAKYGDGLRKALYNYMHETGFEMGLNEWFDFKISPTTIPSNYIRKLLSNPQEKELPYHKQIIWNGSAPKMTTIVKNKKGKSRPYSRLVFYLKGYDLALELPQEIGDWLAQFMGKVSIFNDDKMTVNDMKSDFEQVCKGDFEVFWRSSVLSQLRENELLLL